MTEVEQLDEYDARGLPFIVGYEDEWGINEEEPIGAATPRERRYNKECHCYQFAIQGLFLE